MLNRRPPVYDARVAQMRGAFGVAVRVARQRRTPPMAQWDLAQRAGLQRSRLSTIETGKVDAKLSEQEAIARALGMTLSALLAEAEREHGRT